SSVNDGTQFGARPPARRARPARGGARPGAVVPAERRSAARPAPAAGRGLPPGRPPGGRPAPVGGGGGGLARGRGGAAPRGPARDAYTESEAQMVRVGDALRAEPPDYAEVGRELAALRDLLAPFAAGQVAPGAPVRPVSAAGLSGLIATLDRAISSARAGD